ncbi:MAG: zinc ribbon domain-containing protein [Lysinibacillus sp.]
MNCIHCQKQHAHYETYCSTTGKLIDDSLVRKYSYETLDFCVSCGEPNKKGNVHCDKCGTELVKLSTKKITMDKLIDQGLTAIPDFKNSATFIKGKTNLKEASVEHKNYIKKTPLILLPVGISIAIVMLLSIILVNKIKDNIDLVSDLLDLGGMNFLDAQAFSAFLSYELGIDVSVPDFPIFTMLISLMHNINYSFNIKTSGDGISEVMKFQESNVLLGLLIIPIIALIIGAIVYGWMAKKYNWDFWRGIIYSTALYTLFLLVVSFFARYKANVSGTDRYDDFVKISVEVGPSFINAIITGIILSGIIFTFFGYISYSGKQILTKLEGEWLYFKYAMYAFAATVIGLILHLVNAVIALKSSADDYATDFFSRLILETLPEWAYYITAIYLAITNWYLSLFGKLNINVREYGENEPFEYAWFFKDSVLKPEINELIDTTTFVSPFVIVIIIFAVIGAIGFLLTKNQLLALKEVGVIAAIFTAIQLMLLYFTTISIEALEDSIFSFAAIIAGSYVKIKFFLGK